MLDNNNSLVKSFRMARDRFSNESIDELKLWLINTRDRDSRHYNMPTASEVAGFIVGDLNYDCFKRDAIVEHNKRGLKKNFRFASQIYGHAISFAISI